MEAKQLDTQEAALGRKWFAHKDATQRSAAAEGLYSKTQQRQAKMLHEEVRKAFVRSKVYLTYRDSFFTVKVHRPAAADKMSKEAANIDKLFAELKAEKVATAQGIIYRVNRR
jgi:hypothetical protein